MEPVMKIINGRRTEYIFHPERVLEIHDFGKPGEPVARMYFDSGYDPEHRVVFQINGVSARDMKRSIQENVPEDIGFLKLDYNIEKHGKGARRYLNVDSIVSLHAESVSKQVDGQTVTVGGTRLRGLGYHIVVEGAPFAIAAQIRRVLKRLDQDEEFCCDPPAAEEASEE